MFDLITGFWRSQAVGAAARLGLPDLLAQGTSSSDELATKAQANPQATYRLLRALAGLGVVEATGPKSFRLTPVGETLRSNVPGSMRDMAIAQTAAGHWQPWGRMVDAVKTGKRTTHEALGCEIFEHYARNAEEGRSFSGAMTNLSSMVAQGLVDQLKLQSETVVDVGGAHGLLVRALLTAFPQTRGVLADLPNVVEGAAAELRLAKLEGRCDLAGGDFFKSVPQGDVYLLKQILHDWDDQQCISILRNCAVAMRPGARVYVIEMVLPEDKTPSPAPMMDLNMLVMLPGRERTLSEYDRLFAEAGLKRTNVLHTRSPFDAIEAKKA